MKKIILAMCLLFVLVGCGSGQKLTVELLQSATSREDLAKTLNCDLQDLKQIITNLDNLYKVLPETTDSSKANLGIKYTDDGEICIPKEELKSYFERIDITPENWKDIYEVTTVNEEYKNAFGEVTDSYTYIYLQPKDEYISDYSSALKLHDNVNDVDVTTEDLYLQQYSKDGYYGKEFEEGDILYEYFDENSYQQFCKFDIENFTCTQAVGYVYKSSVPEEYITVKEYDDDYVEKYVICYSYESGSTCYNYVSFDVYSIDYLFNN